MVTLSPTSSLSVASCLKSSKHRKGSLWAATRSTSEACLEVVLGRTLLEDKSFGASKMWGCAVTQGIYNTTTRDELRGPKKLLPKPAEPEEGWTEENPEPEDEYEEVPEHAVGVPTKCRRLSVLRVIQSSWPATKHQWILGQIQLQKYWYIHTAILRVCLSD